MKSSGILVMAAMLAGLSGGGALAQMDTPEAGFYADPVLPDPSPVVTHAFPAAAATADVAAVAPAAGSATRTASARPRSSRQVGVCTALNPCAVSAPPAPG